MTANTFPARPSEQLIHQALQELVSLLQLGHYQQASKLLSQIRAQDTAVNAIPAQEGIKALQQLCQMCSRLDDMATWHHQTADAIKLQQAQLNQIVEQLSVLIASQEWIGADITLEAFQPPASAPPTLWQRVQQFFVTREPLLPDVIVLPQEAPRSDAAPAIPEPLPPVMNQRDPDNAALVVYGLGSFSVLCRGQSVKEWPNRKSKQVFKYLVLHRKQPTDKDILMELFWPGFKPSAARNNLNVTVHNLRQMLHRIDPITTHIIFQENQYQLNPELDVWVDFEAFEDCIRQAQQSEKTNQPAQTLALYHRADLLYQGALFEEERYEPWAAPARQALIHQGIEALDKLCKHYLARGEIEAVLGLSAKQLILDPCHEDAHRRRMEGFMAQGQYFMAVRQYHLCVDTLKEELDVPPGPETVKLYTRLRALLHQNA